MIFFSSLGRFGTGNCLFQIAATVAHARKMKADFLFPKWQFSHRIYPNKLGAISGLELYREPTFNYTEIPLKDNLDLFGFFQSEKYFVDVKDEIISEYTKERYRIKKLNGIALHVRRGDFLNYGWNVILTMDYFSMAMKKAIEILGDKHPIFHIYSDDIQWCKENFKNGNYIFHEKDELSALDTILEISLFDIIITANSSFSIWAAILSGHNNIILPAKWFRDGYGLNERDLIPERWHMRI